MRFANPLACPDCGGAIAGNTSCPHCGLDLTTTEVRELWQLLLKADETLDRARRAPRISAAPAATAQAAPRSPTLPPYRAQPSTPAVPVKRPISTGSVLLSLGALCILVAGFIFITVSWGSLGVTGRAVVLFAFTGIVGGLAAWVTGRGLRGSAEALWAVFLGLFTLDWFAARSQGLWGLDGVSFTIVATVWSAALFTIAALIVVRSKAHVGRNLVAPMVGAGLAPWFGAVVLGVKLRDSSDWTVFWAVFAATLFASAFLLAALRLRHVVTWALLAGFTAAAAALTVSAAVVEAVDAPSLTELTRDAHGVPLLLTVVAAVAVGLLERRTTLVAAAYSALGAALLLGLPVEDAWQGRGAFVVAAALVVLGAVALRGTDGWSRGGRFATAAIAVGLGVAAAPWLANLGSIVSEGALGSGGEDFWFRSSATSESPGPWWLAAIVFGALSAGVVLARWWPEARDIRTGILPVALVVSTVGVLSAIAAASPPYVMLALVAIALGALLAEVFAGEHPAWSLAGPALVALAPVVPLPSLSATLVVWLVAALMLAAIAVRSKARWRAEPTAFAAASWGMGAAGIAVSLADAQDRWIALSLVATAGVGIAAASTVMRTRLGRLGVEAAAALIAVVGLGLAADISLMWQALLWTVIGVVLVLLGFVTPDRPYFRWIGSGALGVAYVLRLAASDVETIEAYTLPFGVLLLAAGLWAMRGDDPPSSMRTLAPAVTLSLVPSLPQALADPDSLRALLLGLGALLFLAVGAWKHWKAPFIAGALVLAILVIVNLGPYAFVIPRWVLIAGAGALLLGAGVTWEDRVRDGRAVARYVVAMR